MQVFPPTSELKPQLMTLLQIRLLKKLGDNAYPFIFVVSITVTIVTACLEPLVIHNVELITLQCTDIKMYCNMDTGDQP